MKKKILIILGSIVLVTCLVFIVTNKTYSVNENIVEIESGVLNNREALSKYASNIAKQYLYKHTLTDYEEYKMDGEGITWKPSTSSKGNKITTFSFVNPRMEPEKLRDKFYANFDCSQFVQNVYYNAYGYSFLDDATKYVATTSVVVDDKGKIKRTAGSLDNYKYANEYLGISIITEYFEKMAEDDVKKDGNIEEITIRTPYFINDSNYITQFYYKRKSDYNESEEYKKEITDGVTSTLQNGDLLLIRYDKPDENGNFDGKSDGGHILFYTNDDIYYYESCDSDNKCSYKVNSTPLDSGFIHSKGTDFKFDKGGVTSLGFDDSYSVQYKPFGGHLLGNGETTEGFDSAKDYLFKKTTNGNYPCTIAILRPLNKIVKGNYTNSLDYSNEKAKTRKNTIALNEMNDLKFTQRVAYNSYVSSSNKEVSSVKEAWEKSNSTPKHALSNYDSINAGDILEYSLTIENMENTSNKYGLTITADIPDGTTFISDTCLTKLEPKDGSKAVTHTNPECYNNGTVTWKNIDPKESGVSAVNIAFKVKVDTPSDDENSQVNFKGMNVNNENETLKMGSIITNVNPSFTYKERSKVNTTENHEIINDNFSSNIYTGTESTTLAKITAIYDDIFDTSLGDISNFKDSTFTDLTKDTVEDTTNKATKMTSANIILDGENKIRKTNSTDRISKMLVPGLWGGRRVRGNGNATHDRTTTFNIENLVIGDIILGTTGSDIDQAVIYLGMGKPYNDTTNYQLIYYDKNDKDENNKGRIKFLAGDKSTARKIVVNTINSDTFVVLRPSQVISKEVIFDTTTDEKIPYTLVTKGGTYGKLTETEPTKEGYTFKGWYKNGNTLLKEDTQVSSFKSFVKVVAKYTANTYVVDFNTNGGNTISSKNVTYDSTYGTLETPTKTGYDFDGWYLDQELTKKVDSTTTVKTSSDHTLYAKWKAKTIKVSFETNGGNTISSQNVTYDSTYGTLPVPSKENYAFEGWYLEQGFINKVNSSSVVKVANAHTLYAKYNANKYNLTIDADGGTYSGDTSIKVAYGSTYTLSTISKTDYTFVRWEVTGSGSSVNGNVFTMGTEDATVKAIWKVNDKLVFDSSLSVDANNKIIYNINSGTIISSILNKIATNGTITLYDNNSNVIDKTNKACTGYIISFKFDSKTVNYVLVVTGDVTGDGNVTLLDVSNAFKENRNKTNNFDIYKRKAIDFDNNNTFDYNDILKQVVYYSDLKRR